MNGADRMGYVGVDGGAATTVDADGGAGGTAAAIWARRLADVGSLEHPAVLGARIGACVFSSFTLPVLWWVLGRMDPTHAAVLAAAFTALVTRPILLLGGSRIGRVLLLQIAISMWVFSVEFSHMTAFMLAVFVPLAGMLTSVTLCARIAGARFADEERVPEADAAVARATQPNVIDIRAAGSVRRVGAKNRVVSSRAASPAASPTKTQAS